MAGYGGTATAGYGGTATAGECGTATAGECGSLLLKYWTNGRYKWVVGTVGEDGVEPNKPYILDVDGKFVEKK
jgi:hypothetical protein